MDRIIDAVFKETTSVPEDVWTPSYHTSSVILLCGYVAMYHMRIIAIDVCIEI